MSNHTTTDCSAKATQSKGEWTAGQLYDIYKSYHNASDAWHAIANEINAALESAKRESAKKIAAERDIAAGLVNKMDECGKQLAAERGFRAEFEKQLRHWQDENIAAQEQLAAAVGMLKEVNALARGNMTGCGTCNHVIAVTINAIPKDAALAKISK